MRAWPSPVTDMKLHQIAVAILSLATATALYAQSTDNSNDQQANQPNQVQQVWKRHHHGGFLKQLNLTDAQKQQLKEYRSSNAADWKAKLAALLTVEKQLQNAIASNPSDEATIRSLVAQEANARADMAVQRAHMQAQLQSILTPDQKQKFTELEQKREARLQKKIDHLTEKSS
jgi:periplasmic protein CpxP/Spy